MTNPIKKGDFVNHKTMFINGKVPMTVIEVNDKKALCGFFIGVELESKEVEFSLDELILVF